MRIPPYYRKPSWQRFFAGAFIGAIISWGFFLFTYGVLQEKQVTIIHKQKDAIEELEKRLKIWEEDIKDLNKETIEKLTVNDVKVHLTNADRYDLSTLTAFKIENNVKEDMSDVIARDIESVFKSRKLLKKAIENRVYKLDDKNYRLKITEMAIYTTVYVELEISFAK
ncbi:sporulation protein [Metabacillus sp. GX 13764]|uniref:sporulation membrane protein YtrI n=1 Tax=Metabacillus kandeliae TaxID=2900151 RepID=UPI001E56D3E2|nr:sporulation membrane protein YtrI [Metabacillus kandeliae]MCD7032787.1 sporulation protein [Metabacillus kandeliae]